MKPQWKYNEILHDFGKDGLEICISTKTFPDRSILIDRKVYDELEGRITAQGDKYVVITVDKKKIYLGRYVLGLEPHDPEIVVHKDLLLVDFRKRNLYTVGHHSEVPRIGKPVRSIYKQIIRDFLVKEEIESDWKEEQYVESLFTSFSERSAEEE